MWYSSESLCNTLQRTTRLLLVCEAWRRAWHSWWQGTNQHPPHPDAVQPTTMQIFSKISSLLAFVCKLTVELTFEKL